MNRFFKPLLNRFNLPPLTTGMVCASVLTLAALGLLATRTQAADEAKPGTPGAGTVAAKAALTVTVSQAKSTTMPIRLAANGGVAAWQEASVGSEVGGLRVLELKAQIGDAVKQGQVLATFAADSVQADVALARAALAEAQANAAEAAANADRARAVQSSGAISAQQVNQYLTQEQTGKARVDSAKAQLDSQLLRMKHTQLLAPDSGIVSARSATVGSVVGAGVEMFRLIRQGRLEWRGEVTSSELGRVTPGTTVVVTAPGGAQARGRVRMVSPTVDVATRNGLVYVDLITAAPDVRRAGPPPASTAPPGGSAAHAVASVAASFKPGMYARGEFEMGSSQALTVPQTAVVVRDGFSYVYRVGADNRVSQLKVQTGRVLGDQVELQSGVNPEDKLVTSGGSFLSDGDLVRVVEASKAENSKENSPPALVKPAPSASK